MKRNNGTGSCLFAIAIMVIAFISWVAGFIN